MQKIAKKFVEVMRECSHVAKNGTNEYHRYKYATAADVLEKAKSHAKNRRDLSLIFIPYYYFLFLCTRNLAGFVYCFVLLGTAW